MNALWTIPEAARRWNLSPHTLRAAVTSGSIAVTRTGPTGKRGVRLTDESVTEYLAKRTTPARDSTSEDPTPSPTSGLSGPTATGSGTPDIPAEYFDLRPVGSH